MAKEYKLNLFEFLDEISKKNEHYYPSLTDEQKKEVSPLVIMRWLSGTNDARQIHFLNELVNPFVFQFGTKHKELLIDLMTLCTSGRKQFYKFNKVKRRATTSKAANIIKEFFGYSTIHALEVLPILSDAEIISFAEQLGKQKPEISELKRELKKRA